MARVFVASPIFHGYWRAISQALQARGHQVVAHTYDHAGLVGKARRRMGGSPQGARDRATATAVSALRAASADVVLTVKGDILGDAWWAEVGRLPHVTWLYDELRRTHYSPETLSSIGPLATYSTLDAAALRAQGIAVAHLPLAFDMRTANKSPIDPHVRNDEVVFVGARYPTREATLVGLAHAGVNVRAYGRDWSAHPVDRLRTNQWHRPDVPAGRDLPRAMAYAEMAAALATLNLHHDQDGFTMRTFEACGVGAVQLIDRADLDGLYDPGLEVATFDSLPELVDLCHRVARDPAWAQRLREAGQRRTLAEHTFDHRVAVLESLWA